jgi:hypothetical protein
MVNYSAAKLKLAYAIQRKIESLQGKLEKHTNKLATVLGGETPSPFKRGKISAAGRARIAAAQKARWAKVKGKVAKPAGKRTMSAAAKKKIAAAARKRWAEAKKAGKNRL